MLIGKTELSMLNKSTSTCLRAVPWLSFIACFMVCKYNLQHADRVWIDSNRTCWPPLRHGFRSLVQNTRSQPVSSTCDKFRFLDPIFARLSGTLQKLHRNTVCPIIWGPYENCVIWQNTKKCEEGKDIANHVSSLAFKCFTQNQSLQRCRLYVINRGSTLAWQPNGGRLSRQSLKGLVLARNLV